MILALRAAGKSSSVPVRPLITFWHFCRFVMSGPLGVSVIRLGGDNHFEVQNLNDSG
jgi:hypothetical protein